MPDWMCRTCGVINLDGQRACESCGHERHPTAPLAVPDAEHSQAWEPCVWKTNGRSCQFIATLWVQPVGNYEFNKFGQVTKIVRPGYCIWHFECLRTPRLQDDFDEFERMHAIWLKRPYCNQFVHHPAVYVWSALRGAYRRPSERLTVTPCNAHDCWVPNVLDDGDDGPPIGPSEARRRIAAIVKSLAQHMAMP